MTYPFFLTPNHTPEDLSAAFVDFATTFLASFEGAGVLVDDLFEYWHRYCLAERIDTPESGARLRFRRLLKDAGYSVSPRRHPDDHFTVANVVWRPDPDSLRIYYKVYPVITDRPKTVWDRAHESGLISREEADLANMPDETVETEVEHE